MDSTQLQVALSATGRAALVRANQESERLGHAEVGTGHLLLALVKDDAGGSAAVLDHLGVSRSVLRLKAEMAMEVGPWRGGESRPLTPSAALVIDCASKVAEVQGRDDGAGSEHLLLAMCLIPSRTIGTGVLERVGLTPSRVITGMLETATRRPRSPRAKAVGTSPERDSRPLVEASLRMLELALEEEAE